MPHVDDTLSFVCSRLTGAFNMHDLLAIQLLETSRALPVCKVFTIMGSYALLPSLCFIVVPPWSFNEVFGFTLLKSIHQSMEPLHEC